MREEFEVRKLARSIMDTVQKDERLPSSNYLHKHKPRFEHMLAELLKLKKTEARWQLLDIGCHYLHFARAAAIAGCSVYGIDTLDFATPEIAQMGAPYGIKLVAGDLRNGVLPFQSNLFDAVVFAETIEHLYFSPLPIMQEIRRLLAPGGYLLLTTPNALRAKNRLYMILGRNIYEDLEKFCFEPTGWSHHREYTFSEVEWLFNYVGLKVVRSGLFVGMRPPVKSNLFLRFAHGLAYGILARLLASVQQKIYMIGQKPDGSV